MNRIADYLNKDSALRALWSIRTAPRGLREVADLCELSPRGASLVLEKLVQLGLAEKSKTAKQSRYESLMTEEECQWLSQIFEKSEQLRAAERVERYSKMSSGVLDWIDPTLQFLIEVKKRNPQ